jgi:hypothetical protein
MTKKIEAFWSDATAEDVARVMKGERVEARFRDVADRAWGDCFTLIGWVNERRHQWRSAEAGGRWNYCQVYREPEWYSNKPDPGPGYRLLEKFSDEPVMGGDFLYAFDKQWTELGPGCNPTQGMTIWYRRRIEAVEPDRGIALSVGDVVHHPSGLQVTITAKGFEVTQ